MQTRLSFVVIETDAPPGAVDSFFHSVPIIITNIPVVQVALEAIKEVKLSYEYSDGIGSGINQRVVYNRDSALDFLLTKSMVPKSRIVRLRTKRTRRNDFFLNTPSRNAFAFG